MRYLLALGALLAGLLSLVAGPVSAQSELSYGDYQAIARSAIRLQRCAMFEPVNGEVGMNMVIGDRFGKLNAYRLLGDGQREQLWTSRLLDGTIEEVLVADLDQDGLDDHLVARTPRRIYVFKLDDFFDVYESQPGDYQDIRAFTVANVDNDPVAEIVLNADRKIHYIDGGTFTREFTSLSDYEATRIRCGDVTGDNRADIVLNTGQVIDASTGEVTWQDEVFGSRLELLDIDGDGILEVLTEGDGTALKVWDVDFRQEKRF